MIIHSILIIVQIYNPAFSIKCSFSSIILMSIQSLNFVPFQIKAKLYSQPLKILINVSTSQHLYRAQYTSLPPNIQAFDNVMSLYVFILKSYDQKEMIRVNDKGTIFIKLKPSAKDTLEDFLVLPTQQATQGVEYEGYCTRKKLKLETQSLTQQIDQIQQSINNRIQHLRRQQPLIHQQITSIQQILSRHTKTLIAQSTIIQHQSKQIQQENCHLQNQRSVLIQSKEDVHTFITHTNQHISTLQQSIINAKYQLQNHLNSLENQNRKNIITAWQKGSQSKYSTKFKIWNWKNHKLLYSEHLKLNLQTLTFQKMTTFQPIWSWVSTQKPFPKDKQTYFSIKITGMKQDSEGMLVGIISQRHKNVDAILTEQSYFYNPLGQLWSGKQLTKAIPLASENLTIGVLLDPMQRTISWFYKSEMIQSIEMAEDMAEVNVYPMVYLGSLWNKVQLI